MVILPFGKNLLRLHVFLTKMDLALICVAPMMIQMKLGNSFSCAYELHLHLEGARKSVVYMSRVLMQVLQVE